MILPDRYDGTTTKKEIFDVCTAAPDAEFLLVLNVLVLAAYPLGVRYVESFERDLGGIKSFLFKLSMSKKIAAICKNFVKHEDVFKIATESQLTNAVLDYMEANYMDAVYEKIEYDLIRFNVDSLLSEDDIAVFRRAIHKIAAECQSFDGNMTNRWAESINTEASVLLESLGPAASLLRDTMQQTSRTIAAAIPDAITHYYREIKGEGFPKSYVLRVIDSMDPKLKISSNTLSPERMQMVRDRMNAGSQEPDYGPIKMSLLRFIYLYFFASHTSEFRAILYLGNLLFSKYEQKKTRSTRSYNNIYESPNKNTKYIAFVEGNEFTCLDLLNYVVRGLLLYMNVDIPVSVYKYYLGALEDAGMLHARVGDCIVDNDEGYYDGLTGVKAKRKVLEKMNQLGKEKAEKEFERQKDELEKNAEKGKNNNNDDNAE